MNLVEIARRFGKFKEFVKKRSEIIIVSNNSVDGCLTASVIARILSKSFNIRFFTFVVNSDMEKINTDIWGRGHIILVDIEITPENIEKNRSFLDKVYDRRSKVIAIVDGHNRQGWYDIMNSFNDLLIEPQDNMSAGQILKEFITHFVREKDLFEILDNANQSAFDDFSGRFSEMACAAIKFEVENFQNMYYLNGALEKRTYCHDRKILGWLKNYRNNKTETT